MVATVEESATASPLSRELTASLRRSMRDLALSSAHFLPTPPTQCLPRDHRRVRRTGLDRHGRWSADDGGRDGPEWQRWHRHLGGRPARGCRWRRRGAAGRTVPSTATGRQSTRELIDERSTISTTINSKIRFTALKPDKPLLNSSCREMNDSLCHLYAFGYLLFFPFIRLIFSICY